MAQLCWGADSDCHSYPVSLIWEQDPASEMFGIHWGNGMLKHGARNT